MSHGFKAGWGSLVEIQPGAIVGHNFEAAGAIVNVRGGRVGNQLCAFVNSIVNISGGTIGSNSRVHRGGLINLSGGVNGEEFWVQSGGVLNVSGGELGARLEVREGGQLNLFGTRFLLGGLEIPGLVFGQPFQIDSRNITLSGLLAEGDQFEFFLNSDNHKFSLDLFYAGVVWEEAMETGNLAADGNFDRLVTQADFDVWEQRLGTAYWTIPEPASWILLATAACIFGLRRRKR